MLCIKIFTYNVQSRSVLKTYFETGDKPTAAQFGDLIDSALMAKAIEQSSTVFTINANESISVTATSMRLTVVVNLGIGESAVINVAYPGGSSRSKEAQFQSGNQAIEAFYYANGYDDITIPSTNCILSYALFVTQFQQFGTCLVNRCVYKE